MKIEIKPPTKNGYCDDCPFLRKGCGEQNCDDECNLELAINADGDQSVCSPGPSCPGAGVYELVPEFVTVFVDAMLWRHTPIDSRAVCCREPDFARVREWREKNGGKP